MEATVNLPTSQEEIKGSIGELQASVPPSTDREDGGICSLLSNSGPFFQT